MNIHRVHMRIPTFIFIHSKVFRRFWWLAPPLHNQLARLPVGRCEQYSADSIVYNYVIAKYSCRCGHWLPFLIGKNNFFPLNYCILYFLFKIYIKAHGTAYHFSMENSWKYNNAHVYKANLFFTVLLLFCNTVSSCKDLYNKKMWVKVQVQFVVH